MKDDIIYFAKLLVWGWLSIPFMQILQKYFFGSLEFAGLIAILIFADTVTGYIASRIEKKSKSNIFWTKLSKKILSYIIVLGVVHHTSTWLSGSANSLHVSLLGEVVVYFDFMIYASLVFRELLSIDENLKVMNFSFIPSWITAKLNGFIKTGKFDKEDKNEEDNNISTN